VTEAGRQGKEWTVLRLRSPAAIAEILVDFLVELTGRGVQQEGDWLLAYCAPGSSVEQYLEKIGSYYKSLRQYYPNLPDLVLCEEELAEERWDETWKEFFTPFHVGKSLVIKPTWRSYSTHKGEVIVEIDPGQAFGTGRHPSTYLCLIMLELVYSGGREYWCSSPFSVLDVGCGSGILSIAAAKLGAKRVVGIDIDPRAVEVAKSNVELNKVKHLVEISSTSLADIRDNFDLVVANLTASVICDLAADMAARVQQGGLLLLSGILQGQEEKVEEIFARLAFQQVVRKAQQEWRAVLLGKLA